jgi:transcriptional regulator with XRE-family HTH domain
MAAGKASAKTPVQRLAKWREDEGVSWGEMARRTGETEKYLKRLLLAQTHQPRVDKLIKIAGRLNLNLNWLLLDQGNTTIESEARSRPVIGVELRTYLIDRLAREDTWSRASLDRWLTSADDMLDFLTELVRDRAIWSAWAERETGRALFARDLPKTTLATGVESGVDQLLRILGKSTGETPRPRGSGTAWRGGGRHPGRMDRST